MVLSAKDELNLDFPEAKPYEKSAHLLKFHSWLPVYVDFDMVSSMSFEDIYTESEMGATAFFQNDLESSYGQIGVEAFGGTMPTLHLQWVYAGWLPKIELRASIGGRNALYQDFNITTTSSTISFENVLDTLKTPYVSGTARIYIPIDLSRGAWTSGLIPSFTVSASNDIVTSVGYDDTFNIYTSKSNPFGIQTSLRAYTMLPAPPSGIFPKLGIGAEVGVVDYPLRRELTPASFYLSLYGYLPGLFRTHGLKWSFFGSKEFGGKWVQEERYTSSLEYALPFAPVDWSFMCPVTYVRNFELHLYRSTTLNRTYYVTSNSFLTGHNGRQQYHRTS